MAKDTRTMTKDEVIKETRTIAKDYNCFVIPLLNGNWRWFDAQEPPLGYADHSGKWHERLEIPPLTEEERNHAKECHGSMLFRDIYGHLFSIKIPVKLVSSHVCADENGNIYHLVPDNTTATWGTKETNEEKNTRNKTEKKGIELIEERDTLRKRITELETDHENHQHYACCNAGSNICIACGKPADRHIAVAWSKITTERDTLQQQVEDLKTDFDTTKAYCTYFRKRITELETELTTLKQAAEAVVNASKGHDAELNILWRLPALESALTAKQPIAENNLELPTDTTPDDCKSKDQLTQDKNLAQRHPEPKQPTPKLAETIKRIWETWPTEEITNQEEIITAFTQALKDLPHAIAQAIATQDPPSTSNTPTIPLDQVLEIIDQTIKEGKNDILPLYFNTGHEIRKRILNLANPENKTK